MKTGRYNVGVGLLVMAVGRWYRLPPTGALIR